jgi:hypothetical protein
MKNLHKLLIFTLLVISYRIESFEIIEDDYFLYTTRTWSEIIGQRQKDLIVHFKMKLQERLKELQTQNHWTPEVGKVLIGNTSQFSDLILEMQSMANSCALKQSVRIEDLIPTGFIIGVGVSGGGNFVVGMGGKALLTLIVVPLEVEKFNKATGEITTHFEVSWSIGGIGQGNMGIGGSGTMAFHGAIGLIWGDMPNASTLTGPAIGMTVAVGQQGQGLGFEAAFVLNTTTQHYNLVSMVTYEAGAVEGISVRASAFYFMNMKEIIKYITAQTGLAGFGNEIINLTELKAGSAQ